MSHQKSIYRKVNCPGTARLSTTLYWNWDAEICVRVSARVRGENIRHDFNVPVNGEKAVFDKLMRELIACSSDLAGLQLGADKLSRYYQKIVTQTRLFKHDIMLNNVRI